MSREVRERARVTGGRTLEVIAGTPRVNAWYYSKFAARIHGEVLELGSGIGNISQHLAGDAARLTVTDVEEPYLDRLRKDFEDAAHVRVRHYDLDAPPPKDVADRLYDVVISLNVLEHIEDDRRAIRDLIALLRPGGRLLTYVPAMPLAFGALDEALGHHRRYSTATLGARMREAGLEVERLEYMNAFGLLGWFVNGRIFRRRGLDPRQVRLFERLVPFVRAEDRVPLPVGLGAICHARKAEG